MSYEEWDAWTRGSAIRRAGYAGLRRNVAVAIGNWIAEVAEAPAEAMAALRGALDDEDALVREHAAWALGCASERDDNSERNRVQDDARRVLGEYS